MQTSMVYRAILAGCVLGLPAGLYAGKSIGRPATLPTAESGFAELVSQTGEAYLKVRERFLHSEKKATKSFFQNKQAKCTDPIQQLWLGSILTRLKDPNLLEQALAEAFIKATQGSVGVNEGDTSISPTNPRPSAGAAVLNVRLGDDAGAFATEIIIKRLDNHWPTWKKQIPITVLQFLGRTRGSYGYVSEATEPRAAYVLLWVLENEEDLKCADLAGQSLRQFCSKEMNEKVRLLRDRISEPQRRAIIDQSLCGMKAELRILEGLTSRAASKPATSQPTTSARSR